MSTDEYDFGKGVHATVFRDPIRKRSAEHVRPSPEDRWVQVTYNGTQVAVPLDAVASIISGLEWVLETEAKKGQEHAR